MLDVLVGSEDQADEFFPGVDPVLLLSIQDERDVVRKEGREVTKSLFIGPGSVN